MAEEEELEEIAFRELEEMAEEEPEEIEEAAPGEPEEAGEVEEDEFDIIGEDEELSLDPSYEELPKIGALSGRLVDLLVLVIAVVMILIFYTNSLWEDVDNLNSLSMGLLLNIGLIGLAAVVLMYVTVSMNIAKGDALARLDNKEAYRAAIEKYNKALTIDRRSKKAWTSKGLALRMVSHETSNLMEALRCHNMAIKIDKKYGVAWVNKGNVLFNLGMSKDAIKCYDKAIELDPDYTVAWVNKGEMLVKMGKRDEAQKCLDKARSLAG